VCTVVATFTDRRMDECQRIRNTLDNDPSRKWGFVVYRCTYADDAAWARSMVHLYTPTRLNLQDEYGSGDLFPQVD
jgi:hypothetical protein